MKRKRFSPRSVISLVAGLLATLFVLTSCSSISASSNTVDIDPFIFQFDAPTTLSALYQQEDGASFDGENYSVLFTVSEGEEGATAQSIFESQKKAIESSLGAESDAVRLISDQKAIGDLGYQWTYGDPNNYNQTIRIMVEEVDGTPYLIFITVADQAEDSANAHMIMDSMEVSVAE